MTKERVGAKHRRVVLERARGACEYCRSPVKYSVQSFSVEHIIPRAKGGDHLLDNLALACQGCNGHKHVKTEVTDPITSKEAALFHPRRQKWKDHFVWSDDFTYIIGRTPTGRATVEALQLNREGLLNLRRLLHPVGEHPPSDPGED